MHLVQVGHAGAGERANQVHRGAGVGVGAHQPRRVVGAHRLVGDERVDHVAAVGRQAQRVDVRRARLGVLAGDARDLHHRHARAVGQHDGHLQQRADVALDVRLGVVGERLGAVTALQQERLAASDLRRAALQRLDLAGARVIGGTLSSTVRIAAAWSVGPRRLLRSGLRQRVVELLAQSRRAAAAVRASGRSVRRQSSSPHTGYSLARRRVNGSDAAQSGSAHRRSAQ